MKYVGAPYNFVPVAQNIVKDYEKPEDLPKHNKLDEELFSGDISCEIEAKTPIFIGNGVKSEKETKEFYKTIDGTYAIPGSSLKGLIRNNMKILGLGCIAGDVEDFNIMYRTVAGKGTKHAHDYRDRILDVKQIPGTKASIPRNVEAGYLCCINGKYYMKGTVQKPIKESSYGKMNYFTLSEKKILVDDKEEKYYRLDRKKLQNTTIYRGEKDWEGKLNPDYVPYYEKIFYKPSDKTVSAISRKCEVKECPEGFQEGYLLSTGQMNKKKIVYIIPEMQEDEGTEIDPKDIQAYKQDYEWKKNQLHGTRLKDDALKQKARDFFALPKEGECRPAFFIHYEGRDFFGYTPYLRIFYSNSVLLGLPEKQRDAMNKSVLDYADSLLGFSTVKQKNGEGTALSYKSRISFEDAKLQGKKPEFVSAGITPGSPKMSSYLDYLVQDSKDGSEITYNNDDFKLRGIKQYWLHERVVSSEMDKKNVASYFKALAAKSVFEGKIHFKNLTKAELGLLLWSLNLGEHREQNIGHGKAYGYGRIGISQIEIHVYDFSKMYGDALTLNIYRETNLQTEECIQEFWKELAGRLQISEPEEVQKQDSIRQFLEMKDTVRMPEEKQIRYMNIGAREYQNREYALGTVENVLKGEPGSAIKREDKGVKNNRQKSAGRNNFKKRRDGTIDYPQSKTTSQGRKVTGEVIGYDKRKEQLLVQVEEKKIAIGMNQLQAIPYEKGKKILLLKNGKDYSVKQS